MEIYGKSLIFVVFILIILSIIQGLINRHSKNKQEKKNINNSVKETFVDKIFNTVITKLDPYEGEYQQ